MQEQEEIPEPPPAYESLVERPLNTKDYQSLEVSSTSVYKNIRFIFKRLRQLRNVKNVTNASLNSRLNHNLRQFYQCL